MKAFKLSVWVCAASKALHEDCQIEKLFVGVLHGFGRLRVEICGSAQESLPGKCGVRQQMLYVAAFTAHVQPWNPNQSSPDRMATPPSTCRFFIHNQ